MNVCGLVAVIGDINAEDKKVFDLLLKLDTTRGKHSTGVARVPWNSDKRKDVEVVKGVGTPWDLIDEKPKEYYNDWSNNPGPYIMGNYIALMGHNRWATVGAINEENAHPFEAGRIVGMQNGTLPQHSINKLDDYQFYGTDTEALMYNIDLHGIENVIPKITGAWALMWYNRDEDSFNILRNKERPLHFAWKKNKKVLYIASESWMLYAAFDKLNIDVYEDDRGDCVWQFLSDTHYRIPFPKNGAEFHKDTAWEKSSLKGYEYKPVTYTSTYTPKSAQSSANVFMGNSSTSSDASVEYWVARRDQYVEFTVDGTWSKDEQGKSYIFAEAVHDKAEIRIYPSAKHPHLEFDLGDQDVASYAAKIKKIKVLGAGTRASRFYMTLDLDTLMKATYRSAHYRGNQSSDIDWDDDIPWERLVMDKLDPLDEYGWFQKVAKGCAWCSCEPELHEAPNVKWIGSEDEFLCGDCASNPEVTQYVSQYTCA